MTKRHRFGALPQPTCGQIGAVKYCGSVHHILITHMDPKVKYAEYFLITFDTSEAVGRPTMYCLALHDHTLCTAVQ